MVEVAEARNIEVEWVIFSLRHRNRDNPGYDSLRPELNAQHPPMRVLAAAGKLHGYDAVGRLYTALGTLSTFDLRLTSISALAVMPGSRLWSGLATSTTTG